MSYSQDLRPRQQVSHAKRQFVRDCEEAGERSGTNLDEKFWSTLQEMLDRRREVSSKYLPLYLGEHLWRYNHQGEPVLNQLQAFIRNARDVVVRGDDKPCDEWEAEKALSAQLALLLPKAVKVRNEKKRSRIGKKYRRGATLAAGLLVNHQSRRRPDSGGGVETSRPGSPGCSVSSRRGGGTTPPAGYLLLFLGDDDPVF